MKNFFNYYATNNGKNVFFCTDNDEVKEGKVIAQDIIIREEGNDLVTLTIETEDKAQHKLSYKLCYPSIEDYRMNRPIALKAIHYTHFKGIFTTDNKPAYYCIENGQVVRHEVELKKVRAEWDDKHGWVFTSPEIPDMPIYSDPDVAEQMCTTTWTDENGKQHTKEGLLSLLLLDDEQKAALQTFQAALQRCNELKVAIGFSTDTNHLYAWSKAKVKSAYFTYGIDEGEGEEAHVFDDAVFDNFNTDMTLEYVGCDDTMCVVRKDKDEQKAE